MEEMKESLTLAEKAQQSQTDTTEWLLMIQFTVTYTLLYLLEWCFLQQTSPDGLSVNPSHKRRLLFPNSSTPSVIRRPLTITTHILAFTYTERAREKRDTLSPM